MKYNFSKSTTNLVITLDIDGGKYNSEIINVSDPNITLENGHIWLYENGKYLRYFLYNEIGTISGVVPTSSDDAYAKLNVIISSLAVSMTPLTTSIPLVILTKSFISNNIYRLSGINIKATTSPVIASIVTINVYKHAANARTLVGTLTILASGSNPNTLNVAGTVAKYEVFEFVVTSATTSSNDILILKIEPVA